MKKIYLILFTLLVCITASAQWSLVGTAFTGSVRGMHFFDENNGVAVGGDNATTGYVALTSDGGVTWTSSSISGTFLLRSVFFLTPDTGFTCGQGGTVYKTTDAGATWTNIYTNAAQYFRAVTFVSSSVGFLGGAGGTILKTTDGGSTWTSTSLGQTGDVIQLQMVDANIGYAVGSSSSFTQGYVVKTEDGGATWTLIYSEVAAGFLALTVVDAETVYVGGNSQTIVKTTDGGDNWTTVNTGTAGTSFRSAAHTSDGAIYLADDGTGNVSNGSIFSSIDEGTTWNDTSFTGIVWLNITFPTSSVGYASNTVGGIYKLTIPAPPPPQWTQVTSAFTGTIRGIHFTSADVGFAVGGDGVSTGDIAKTTDGGSTWTNTTFTGVALFRSASFVSPDTGWVSASGGLLYKTVDGGSTWSLIYTGVSQYFRAVDFVSSQVGFLAGGLGTILKTTDGGTTWTTTTLDQVTSDVIQLDMVDANTGYAACANSALALGYIYKTVDGGATWTQVYSDAAIGILALGVVDANTVYAGGQNQVIVKTTDGGATWSNVYTGLTGFSIRGGDALTNDKSYMVDASSYIFNTEDAGTSWNDTILLTGGLFAVHFPTSTVGYTGGFNGYMYRIELPCSALGSIAEISGETTYCSGDTATFAIAEVGGADHYNWLLPEGSTFIDGEGTNSITVTIGSNAGAISVTAASDCDSVTSAGVDITVNLTPEVATITFDAGVLTSSAPSGNQWYYNGAEISGAVDPTYTPTQNGTYTVVVTSAEGCSSQSEPFEVVGVGIVGIITDLPLTIYPNPMNQFAQINISSSDASLLIISDVQGKLIMSIPVTSSQMVLSKNDLSDGMYMVQLISDKNELISRTKLIVQ